MKKILLIEDEPNLVEIYQMAFKEKAQDFIFLSALTTKEGLRKIREEKPDLVLLDLKIEGELEGFEILEETKKNPETKNIKFIALTNVGEASVKEKVKKLGAEEYIIKTDVTPFQLVEIVKEKLKD